MTTLGQWFSASYRLPPNHPLFIGETLTYWREQYFIDLFRKREVLWDSLQKVRATSAVGKAQQERQAVISDRMGAIDDINSMLGETRPDDNPAPGKVPEFLRQAAAERRNLSG